MGAQGRAWGPGGGEPEWRGPRAEYAVPSGRAGLREGLLARVQGDVRCTHAVEPEVAVVSVVWGGARGVRVGSFLGPHGAGRSTTGFGVAGGGLGQVGPLVLVERFLALGLGGSRLAVQQESEGQRGTGQGPPPCEAARAHVRSCARVRAPDLCPCVALLGSPPGPYSVLDGEPSEGLHYRTMLLRSFICFDGCVAPRGAGMSIHCLSRASPQGALQGGQQRAQVDLLPDLLQEKRLSAESGLSEDSQPSAGSASQGEPEGPPTETQGPSQQEATLNAPEEAAEETYEEVRLGLRPMAAYSTMLVSVWGRGRAGCRPRHRSPPRLYAAYSALCRGYAAAVPKGRR